MKHLEQVTSMVTSPAGRVFFSPAEPAEVLFILKKGNVAISRISPDGKKLILTTLQAGTIFGEMAIIGQRMHETFAEALTECVICIMSQRDVEDLLLADPRIAVRLVKALGERLTRAEARIEEMAFKPVPARLASLLLRLGTESDWRGRPIVQGLTHQQLGELVGTYRETATAILGQFRNEGLIEIGRRRIVLLDPAGLQEITEAYPADTRQHSSFMFEQHLDSRRLEPENHLLVDHYEWRGTDRVVQQIRHRRPIVKRTKAGRHQRSATCGVINRTERVQTCISLLRVERNSTATASRSWLDWPYSEHSQLRYA